MKLLDHLFDVFGRRRAQMIGATTQSNDLMAALYVIRAQTYLKLTGKKLPSISLPKSDAENMTDSISPSRRLLRKDF